jgi:NO-binding membrane sensor protein with MHYT domain
MLSEFFQTTPVASNAMQGSYSYGLVILSYLVAVLASYVALDVTGQLRDASKSSSSRLIWLLGGSFAMGAGIWSMHFVGMLAFSMPGMSMSYDLAWTGLSMIVAVIASGLALFLLKNQVINIYRLGAGGVILGLAIATMHYTGMQAMAGSMDIHYIPGIFTLSIVIAIIASETALWLAIKSSRAPIKIRLRLKIISALIMGAAICGMHYTGMAAAVFMPKDMTSHVINSLDPQILAMFISSVTTLILGIAFFLSLFKEKLHQQLLVNARQAGMTEVATSVLHNVGNILNSVNVSAETIVEKINHTRLKGLNDLSQLMEDNKQNFGSFVTNDPRGQKIPEYVKALCACWDDDKKNISNEASTLISNIELIKNIISMQQDIGKAYGLEQFVSIADLLQEALIIVGLSDSKKIDVQLNIGKLNPIFLDKIKLMQIVVNLLGNAKDSVNSINANYKAILIKANMADDDQFIIQVSDNGRGILPENITKIFSYGFTTKVHGHGFGLHSSANTIKQLGGTIFAKSEGEDKGACFVLKLPCEFSTKAVKETV